MLRNIYVSYSSTVVEQDDSIGENYCGDWFCVSKFNVEVVTTLTCSSPYDKFYTAKADGEPVYVLSIIYSTGDSFGTSTGNGEIIWTFDDVEQAKTAAREWNTNRRKDRVEIQTQFGPLLLGNPAYDWFSTIQEIRLEEFLIDGILINSSFGPNQTIEWDTEKA